MILLRLLVLGLLLFPLPSFALELTILLPEGRPAANAKVSILGSNRATQTDAEGRAKFRPDPKLPFSILVIGPRGEIYPPVRFDAHPGQRATVRLEAAFQESMTVVTGAAPHTESAPASSSTLVTIEDIEERMPTHLVDALEDTPGVSGGEGGASSVPVIRGLARGRTLILVDGARIMSERRAGASASFLDSFVLSTVEVVRGPGSVAYGSDAFGGVIHARTRDPVPGEQFGLRYQLGSAWGGTRLRTAGVEISTGTAGRGAAALHLHAREAPDDFDPYGQRIVDSSWADHGTALRYVFDTSRGRLRLGLAVDEGDDVGKPSIESNRIRTRYPDERSRRLTFALDLTPSRFWDDARLSLFAGTYDVVLERDRIATDDAPRRIDRSDTSSTDASARFTASKGTAWGTLSAGADLVSRLGLRAGVERIEFGEEETTTRDLAIEDADRLDAGTFFSYSRLAGTISISAGVRADAIVSRNRGGYFGTLRTSHAAPSGYLAATIPVGGSSSLTLQASSGFREPTLSDRYYRGPTGRGFITGNPQLDPERSYQLDSTWRWETARFALTASGYLYRIEDLVERYRSDGDFLFRNRGHALLRGFELEGAVKLSPELTLQLGTAIAGGEADGGAPIDDVAPPNATALLRWAGARGYSLLRVEAHGEHDEPGPTELRRPARATLDAGFGWRFSPLLELRLLGRNLTDTRYYASPDEASALAPGRSFTLMVSGKM